MTDSTRRHDAIALAILAAVITLLFADILLGVNVLYIRDVAHYYYPAKHVLREIVLGGELPYWNPYFGAGQPMAANPEHEVFYPLTWLILLPSYRIGFHLLTLIHLYVGAFAMYALLRSMRVRAEAAFLGALSFAIGGIAVSNLNLQPILFSVVWMPLTCLYTRRFLLHRAWRDFALAAFFFGVQVLVGEPSTLLQTGLLLGMYALYRIARDRSARPLAMVALIAVTAAAVGAVQILPALDHAADSVRARGLDFELVTSWSTPPHRLLEVVYPEFFGRPDFEERTRYWGGRAYGERGAPFLYSIYAGLLLGTVLIAGLVSRTRGWALTLGVSAFGVLFALGAHTPLWQLLYDAGVRSLRYPEKFLLLPMFAAIVFGASTLDELLAGNERLRRNALITAGVITGIAIAAAGLARTPLYPPLFAEVWKPRLDRLAPMVAASATGWLIAAGRGVIVFLLIRNAARSVLWTAVATAFVVLDLGTLLIPAVPRMPGRYYEEPPLLVQRLPPDREQWRLFHHADWHKQRPAVQAYYPSHPDVYWVHRNILTPMMPARHGIRMALETDFDMTALTPTADFVQSVADLSDLRRDWVDVAASMSNVWYRVVFRDPALAFAEARGDLRVLQPVGILALPHYPRYYFADRVETIVDRADFVRKLGGGAFGKRTAFVQRPAFAPAAGRVLGVSETANTARIDVETSGRAFLVVSVTPHKYWRVLVDGRPAEAVVTNVGYQGMVVPTAGRHVVEMRYRNPLIAIGAAISVATLLALAALGARSGALRMKHA